MLVLGIALIVLPGPAFVVIPLGLAILAAEFVWARKLLRLAKAVLPFGSQGTQGKARKRITMESIRRSFGFLMRQVRRALVPRRRGI